MKSLHTVIYDQVLKVHCLPYGLLVLVILASLLPTNTLSAQQLRFDHIGVEQGLSQNTVEAIVQDKQGFMWFATQDGLNKYDGYSFTTYSNYNPNKHFLAANYIRSLLVDSQGNLWAGTQGMGLCKYDDQSDSFNQLSHEALATGVVDVIYEDTKRNLWIGTAGSGLFSMNSQTGEIKRFTSDSISQSSLSSNDIQSIVQDRKNQMWIGTKFGLDVLDISNYEVRRELTTSSMPSLISDDIQDLYIDKNDHLWIATYEGLYIYDPIAKNLTAYTNKTFPTLSDPRVLEIYEDKDQTIWLGTRKGLCRVETDSLKGKIVAFDCYTSNPKDPNSLSNDRIVSIMEDSNNIMWIGSYFGGVNKYDKSSANIRSITTEDGLVSNIIRAIHKEPSGRLWVATDKGLNSFETNGTVKLYTMKPGDPGSLGNNEVRIIYVDSRNTMWVGTGGGILHRYNRTTDTFTRFELDKKIGNNQARFIYEDCDGDLWFGTDLYGGLNLFDRKKGEFIKSYMNIPGDSTSISTTDVTCMIEDNEKNIWVGTAEGLNLFDKQTGTFVHVKNDPKDPRSLSYNYIKSLLVDYTGNLWVGTSGGGINVLLDNQKFTFRSYSVEDGLPNGTVYGILQDQFNRTIWMSTNRGISNYRIQRTRFKNYDITDGLLGYEFNTGAYHQAADGEMFFGGLKGLNTFYPDSIQENIYAPNVVITDFKVFNKSVDLLPDYMSKPINYVDTIHLSLADKSISFEFSALHFANPLRNNYVYKLEGFDQEWTQTDATKRFATYTNLPPGTYTFQVKASNNDGIWNEDGKSVVLVINPPFWMQRWFQVTAFILMIMIVYALYRIRLNYLLSQRKKLRAEVQARTHTIENQNKELSDRNSQLQETLKQLKKTQGQLRESDKMASLGVFSAGIGHEINNPLNFIKGGVEGISKMLDNNTPKEKILSFFEAVLEGVNRVSDIVKSLSDFSRDTTHMNEECDIHEIIDNCLVVMKSGFRGKIELNKKYETTPYFVVGNTGRLHQAFFNLLSNAEQAITKQGRILIETKLNGTSVIVTIKDNGQGIEESDLNRVLEPFYTTKDPGVGTGLGLSITYSILEEHGGTMKIESEYQKGTTITLRIPASLQ